MSIKLWLGLLAASVATAVHAEPLEIGVSIDPLIMGSRQWDGLGVSSSAIDDDRVDGPLGFMLGGIAGPIGGELTRTLGQAAVDQLDDRLAAPDAKLCIIRYTGAHSCLPSICKDSTVCTWRIEEGASDFGLFNDAVVALALYDSDAGNVAGAFDGDDMIGFGILPDEAMVQRLRARDPAALAEVQAVRQSAERIVREHIPSSQRHAGALLDAPARLSRSGCGSASGGCALGLARITFDTGSGW